MIALGGYAAEKIQYNTSTTGVSSDFSKAMSIAHIMVWQLGMGKSGLVGDYSLVQTMRQGGEFDPLAEETKLTLNKDTNQILQDCIQEVTKTLKERKEILDRFAKELLTREELEYDEIIAIFSEYGIKEDADGIITYSGKENSEENKN